MNKKKLAYTVSEWENGNEKPFKGLFQELHSKTFLSIKKLTKSAAAAEEIFMEGMYTFLEHFFMEKKPLPENAGSYFYRICYNLWFDRHIRKKYQIILSDSIESLFPGKEQEESITEDSTQLQQKALTKAIDELKGLCKKIFNRHIVENQKLKDIWDTLGFKNYQSLVQANYRCKKQLTKRVVDIFEDLINIEENRL